MNWIGLLVVGSGVFSVMGAILDWDFYMEHRKARWIVALVGRFGARIFYFLFGVALIVLGVLITMGILTNRA